MHSGGDLARFDKIIRNYSFTPLLPNVSGLEVCIIKYLKDVN